MKTARMAGRVVVLILAATTASLANDVAKPTTTSGVSVSLTSVLPLAAQMPAAKGYVLRLRRVVMAPKAIIGHHSHKDRPSIAYVISGQLTEHRDDGTTRAYGPGESFEEGADLNHWAENAGATETVLIGVDLVPK